MLKGIVGQLAMLVVAMVLYPDLADSQCTTRDCKDKVDVLSVSLRNQQVVKELQEELRTLSLNEKRNSDVVEQLQQELDSNQKVVEQLKQELRALNSKEERLQQEVNSTEERNQKLLGWLQQQVNELKQKLITLETKCFLGTTRHNAARSCKQILDSASCAANGVYWICVSPNCADVHKVFCDMRSGGWTLIGQIGGVAGNIHESSR